MRTTGLPSQSNASVSLSRPLFDINALLSAAGIARARDAAPESASVPPIGYRAALDLEALLAASSRPGADLVDEPARTRLSGTATESRIQAQTHIRPGILKPPSQRTTPDTEGSSRVAPAPQLPAAQRNPQLLAEGESPPRADDRIPFISQSRLRRRFSREDVEAARHELPAMRPPASAPAPSDPTYEEHQSRQRSSQRVVELTRAAPVTSSKPAALMVSSPSPTKAHGQSERESFGGESESAHNLSFPNEFVLIKGRASDISSNEQLSRDHSEDEPREPLTAAGGRSRSAAPPPRAVAPGYVSRENSEPRPGSGTARRDRAPAEPIGVSGVTLSGDGDSEAGLAVSDRIQSFISSLREHSASREALIKKEYSTRMQDMENIFGSKDKCTHRMNL